MGLMFAGVGIYLAGVLSGIFLLLFIASSRIDDNDEL